MNELMKQLQQWANEGRYDWENGTFKWEGIYINNPPLAGWEVFVQLVLEGTIQVWRPVEHYKPPNGSDVLAIVDDMVMQGSIDNRGLFDDDARYCGVPFTHWQPLPQLIQEGKETEG